MTERFAITIEAPKAERPGIIRMRKLLKALLRAHGLRCVTCERVRHETAEADDREGEGRGE